MRFFYLILLLLPHFSFAQTHNENVNNAASYNNFIVQEQNKLIGLIIEFNLSNLYNTNNTVQNSQSDQILKQVEFSLNKVNALGDFQGDSKLKNEALEVLKSYKAIFDIEFNEINTLRSQREHSIEAMEKYTHAIELAEQKIKLCADRFSKAQMDFARKHKLSIQQNKQETDLINLINLNSYVRSISLEYFKVSFKDNSFLDAMNEQKTEIMESLRTDIMQTCDYAIKNLTNIKPIPIDSFYRKSALELIQFHKKLAEGEYIELIAIIKKTNRTEQDVNRFNQLVQLVNDQTQILLTNFNNRNKELIRKNIIGN